MVGFITTLSRNVIPGEGGGVSIFSGFGYLFVSNIYPSTPLVRGFSGKYLAILNITRTGRVALV